MVATIIIKDNHNGSIYTSSAIYLNGDTAAANALDDYEEGYWTPTIIGTTATGQTYSAQSASYTKIGNNVHAQCYIDLPTKGTISGPLRVQGLPFTVTPTNQSAATFAYTVGFNLSSSEVLQGWVYSGNFVYLFRGGGSTDATQVTTSHIDTSVKLAMQATYTTGD
jgi:hypothetical protein